MSINSSKLLYVLSTECLYGFYLLVIYHLSKLNCHSTAGIILNCGSILIQRGLLMLLPYQTPELLERLTNYL